MSKASLNNFAYSVNSFAMAAPIFLLAPPRSFTSVINAMIGQHPQIYGLPELNLFNVENLMDLWRMASIGDTSSRRHGFLRAVAEIYAGEQTSAAVTMAQHWAAAREDCTTSEIFHELAAKIDPLIPIEKSPSYTINVERLSRIYKACPDARFIHLVRHPITQCKSVLTLSDGVFALFVNAIEFQEGRVILDPQIAWHDMNINILNFLDGVPKDQQLRIRGEEIMAQPEQYLGMICRWLNIRDDEDAVEQMMHPEQSPFACIGPVNALFGNDPIFLRSPTFRPHIPKVPSLNDPLPWRDDGKGLYPEVITLAREFGY